MVRKPRLLSVLFLVYFGLFHITIGISQQWEFVKEREGIRIYTGSTEDSPLKSFKGETYLKASMESIAFLIGNAENFDWWDDKISEIEILEYKEDQYIKYYLVYDVPWPVSDRDLCVQALIRCDPVSGTRIVDTRPLAGIVPEKPGLIRITDYWQRWTVEPVANGMVHLVLEGFADPRGYIPAWIINMVIIDTPLNVIRKVRDKAMVAYN